MEIIRKITANICLLTFVVFFITSCQNNIVFEQTKDVEADGWHKDSIVSMHFKPLDTTQAYDLYFLVRNDNAYPYSNLFLIAGIENDKHKIVDTLEYEMADVKGNWLGSGIGDLKESKLIYKKNYHFHDTLPVDIRVQQAVRKTGQTMGDDILPGIKTIGIIIEKHSE